jgi:hypothetical protein
VRSPGQETGTIVLNELHSSTPGGPLETAGGTEGVLLTPEFLGAACWFHQFKVNFTGTLKDTLAMTGKESKTLDSSLAGSSVAWINHAVTVKGELNTSLTSGESFGVFTG